MLSPAVKLLASKTCDSWKKRRKLKNIKLREYQRLKLSYRRNIVWCKCFCAFKSGCPSWLYTTVNWSRPWGIGNAYRPCTLTSRWMLITTDPQINWTMAYMWKTKTLRSQHSYVIYLLHDYWEKCCVMNVLELMIFLLQTEYLY